MHANKKQTNLKVGWREGGLRGGSESVLNSEPNHPMNFFLLSFSNSTGLAELAPHLLISFLHPCFCGCQNSILCKLGLSN